MYKKLELFGGFATNVKGGGMFVRELKGRQLTPLTETFQLFL